MNLRNKVAVSSGAIMASVAGSSYAADLTAVTDALTTAEGDIATIGTAMLALAVVAVTFKWLKGSLFG